MAEVAEQLQAVNESDEAVIERLAKLSPIEYDRVRDDEAKNLGDGVRVATLDKLVKNARRDADAVEDLVSDDMPHSEPVQLSDLLLEIQQVFDRYMALPVGASAALSLWVAGTYVYDRFTIFPKLAVLSPEKRCGKTTLLEAIGALACRSMTASNITPAAIFRVIDQCQPTLIIDEADTFVAGRNDDLIGIINSGHRKSSAYVVRVVGDDYTPKRFSTWSPMALAAIKNLPGTVEDRSIVIKLRRKMQSDRVERMPVDLPERCRVTREKLMRWADDCNLVNIEPPTISNDRAMDNWLPIFSIAADAKWIEHVEASYFILNQQEDEHAPGVMLLIDIQEILQKRNAKKITSHDLVDRLVSLEERPWCEWRKGNPMTQNSLAKLLSSFGIKSKNIRLGNDIFRGFVVDQFTDAFERYIPDTPVQSATRLQPSVYAGSGRIESATQGDGVALQNLRKPAPVKECSTVALQNPPAEKSTPEVDENAEEVTRL